jgi:NAD(P)-dependent dehydrogenase (short-subunit alcohol dehydrogenase family)
VPTLLVTGASRGIGRAVAERMSERGWQVFAGVRRREDAPSSERITPVVLDVTDSEQVAGLDGALPPELDAVVNNAGIVVGGPMEAVSADELRRQLEVNVIGQVAVTQAVLPRLRASQGRVLFVSSTSGRVATPCLGAYAASKFALEGLADAMRVELRPWGISVILIEPSNTDTDLWRGADDMLESSQASMSEEQRRLYEPHLRGMRRVIPFMQRTAVPVDRVVATVERALTESRPRARYAVGAATKAQLALMGVTPTRLRDSLLGRMIGV